MLVLDQVLLFEVSNVSDLITTLVYIWWVYSPAHYKNFTVRNFFRVIVWPNQSFHDVINVLAFTQSIKFLDKCKVKWHLIMFLNNPMSAFWFGNFSWVQIKCHKWYILSVLCSLCNSIILNPIEPPIFHDKCLLVEREMELVRYLRILMH